MPGEVVRAVVRLGNENRRPDFVLLVRADKVDDSAPRVFVVMACFAVVIAEEEDAVIEEKVLVEDSCVEVPTAALELFLTRSYLEKDL